MSIETLTSFLGWCVLFNIVALLLLLLVLAAFKGGLARINARLFGVSEEDARRVMMRLFYQYRILFAFFNLIPWLVLYFLV